MSEVLAYDCYKVALPLQTRLQKLSDGFSGTAEAGMRSVNLSVEPEFCTDCFAAYSWYMHCDRQTDGQTDNDGQRCVVACSGRQMLTTTGVREVS